MARPALDRLFRPASVALIGASSDPGKIGGRPLHFLKKHGFAGDIWPVNPRASEIEGFPCFPDIESLPGVPDIAMVLVGPSQAADAVAQLAKKGTGAAIILAGGFAETGKDGIARQAGLVAAAGNMRLLGPNTIGLLNVTDGITLSASGALDIEERRSGGVAVISQSGGILGSLLSRAAARGMGLSHLVATGNEADIDVSDVMAFLAADPATRVVALYLETIRKPVQFRQAAGALAEAGKRIVVYKVGRSETGARAAASHTGALAGEDRMFDALFRQAGAIRVDRYSDLIDVPMGLSACPPLAGRRIAILTHTGGAAGLVADICGLEGFETPAPSTKLTAKLGELLQDDGFAPDRNPVDLTLAGLDPEIVFQAITALAESGEYDAVIPVVGSSSVGRPYMVADPVIRASETCDLPVVVYTSPHTPAIVSRLNAAGVPAFDAPEACASVLSALLTASETPVSVAKYSNFTVPDTLPAFGDTFNEWDAKRVFAQFGINTVRELPAPDPDAAAGAARELGGPVVVKILARDVLHKTEIGGVRTGVAASDAPDICRAIAAAAGKHGISSANGFLIQEQIAGATELILGYRRDPALGPAILLGAGGTMAELFDDVTVCLLPADADDIARMIDRLQIATVLRGHRGRPGADIDGIIGTVARFAHMCTVLDDRLLEAEINPLFVVPADGRVVAGDAVLVLRDSPDAE